MSEEKMDVSERESLEKSEMFEMPDGRKLSVSQEDLEYIFKGYRPRLMSPEDFRFIGKILKKRVKRYLKGKLVHVSKVTEELWEKTVKDMEHKPRQRGNTYVRSKK